MWHYHQRRPVEDKIRLKRLYDKTKNSYGLGGAYYDEDKKCIIRYKTTTSKNCKYWKKQANRRVRRCKDVIMLKGSVKKFFPLKNILL